MFEDSYDETYCLRMCVDVSVSGRVYRNDSEHGVNVNGSSMYAEVSNNVESDFVNEKYERRFMSTPYICVFISIKILI